MLRILRFTVYTVLEFPLKDPMYTSSRLLIGAGVFLSKSTAQQKEAKTAV